jgi:hypothetical protein
MSETVSAPRGPDILVRDAPQLSATSDAPLTTPDAPPVSASNDPTDHDAGVPTEMSPEAQATATRRTKADAAPDAAAEEGEKAAKPQDADPDLDTMDVDGRKVPTPPWAKREITKARNKQREAQSLADTQAKELVDLRAKFEELATKVPAPAKDAPETKSADPPTPTPETKQPDPAEVRPTRDQFDDPDAYDTALSEWAGRQGERRAEEKLTAAAKAKADEAAKATQDAEIARINEGWMTRKAAAEAKYSDYKQVTERDDLKISGPMAHAIMLAQNGPDVAYHLGKNDAEAERIAALANPAQQVMEIATLAARLAAPPPRATPRPRPLDPIDTGSSPANAGDREESMEEVAARVNSRYLTQRKPFLAATDTRR